MEFYDKFVDKSQDLSEVKNLLSARQMSNNYLELSKRKCFWEYDAVTLTMIYLKVLHNIISQNS